MKPLPRSGPIWLDGRRMPPARLLLRIRQTVRGIREGARELRVQVGDADAAQAVMTWAQANGVATSTVPSATFQVVYAFLLPSRFGEPPEATWRELAPAVA